MPPPPQAELGETVSPDDAAATPDVAPEPRSTEPPPPHFRFAPDADVLIETEIVPLFARLADDAQHLQNAVIRHCSNETAVTRQALEAAFTATVVDASKLLPLSFGSEAAEVMPSRLLTEAASTVFSRNRLAGLMEGVVPAPQSLAALRQEEAGLMGLSALERLLLARSYKSTDTLANRCRLALTIAANVRVSVAAALESWRTRDVAEHWASSDEELADRLRLRDLIQGTIDAVDRFDRDVAEFARERRNNGEVPFAQPQNGMAYLASLAEGLVEQMRRLNMYADPGGDAEAALAQISTALMAGCERLLAAKEGDEATYLVAFDQAHADIIDRLPELFGFDATAFNRPLTSFELQRPEGEAEAAPETQ
ncbi:MAG: imelysin family protein [Pseudomonadota bacterium]